VLHLQRLVLGFQAVKLFAGSQVLMLQLGVFDLERLVLAEEVEVAVAPVVESALEHLDLRLVLVDRVPKLAAKLGVVFDLGDIAVGFSLGLGDAERRKGIIAAAIVVPGEFEQLDQASAASRDEYGLKDRIHEKGPE